ncbi:Lipase [Porphyridium purpureum]|uniref:Lipase n=1 Tax=Porphyridium purpureum TaxID=35688 RepID=A0A5J4YMK3_PORPP|nr:Lipase [Porphyridium purpureum]|eukprot:POR0652..scf249_10
MESLTEDEREKAEAVTNIIVKDGEEKWAALPAQLLSHKSPSSLLSSPSSSSIPSAPASELGLRIADIIEQDRRRSVLWYFQIMKNRDVLGFVAFIVAMCVFVSASVLCLGIIAATTGGTEEHIAKAAKTSSLVQQTIVLVMLALILMSTISYGIIVFFLVPRDRKEEDKKHPEDSRLHSMGLADLSSARMAERNHSSLTSSLVGKEYDSLKEMRVVQTVVFVLVFLTSVACLFGFSLIHWIAEFWTTLFWPVYDSLVYTTANAYFYVYIWATADLAVLALDPVTGLPMSLNEYKSNHFWRTKIRATDTSDESVGWLDRLGLLLLVLMWDKVLFFIAYSATEIPMSLVFRIRGAAFAWHAWIPLVRVHNDASVSFSAGQTATIAVGCAFNIMGLAVYLFKARRASKILNKQPFFVNSKRTLYFRFTFLETIGVWFVTVFFLQLFQVLVIPLTGPFGLLYYNTSLDWVYLTGGIVGILTLVPLAVWVLSITILFLPATYPGPQSLFRFKYIPIETSLQDANTRARFMLEEERKRLVPRLGHADAEADLHSSWAACAPHVFCWRYAGLCYNFSKLAYAPVALNTNSLENKSMSSSASDPPLAIAAEGDASQEVDALETGFSPDVRTLLPMRKTERFKSSRQTTRRVVNVEGHTTKRIASGLRNRVRCRSGFEVAADVTNTESGTRAVVFCHGEDDHIAVAFRGTVSMKDLETDVQSKMVDMVNKWDTFSRAQAGTLNKSNLDVSLSLNQSRGDTSVSLRAQLEERLASVREENASDSKVSGVAAEQVDDVLQKVRSRKRLDVHSGFLAAYFSIRSALLDALLPLLAAGPLRPVLICGHSLGGALSVLLAFDLMVCQLIPAGTLYCMTFGSPKLGSPLFAQAMRVLLPNMFRVVFVGDPVTKIPRRDFVGLLGKKFSHAGHLVLISQNGALLLTPSIVEKMFTHRASFDINRHRMATYAQGLNAFASSFGSSFDVWTHTFNDVVEEDEQGLVAIT